MRDPNRITLAELALSRAIQIGYDARLALRRAAYRLGVGHCPGCPRRRGKGHKMDCGWVR